LAYMQENLEKFELKYSASSANNDNVRFVLHFDRNDDGAFILNDYDAVLRRAIKMPTAQANEIEQKMKTMDWDIALYGYKPGDSLLLSVQNIKRDLEKLASSGVYGKEAAENLKFRYWQGTVLEHEIENPLQLKSLYETSHQFTGDALCLTAQEAYFFLSVKMSDRLQRYKNLISTSFLNIKNTFMNNDNFEFLQDSLKYLGFGEKLQLNKQLKEKIGGQPKDFQLNTQASFDPSSKLDAVLHFRKSDQSDMYFFNKYDASLKNADDPSKDRAQTFYINKGSGVTLKEAFNLLEGRAVNKDLTNQEGQKYNAWMKLNFNEKDPYGNYKMGKYTQGYGFNLERQLGKVPVEESSPNHAKYNEILKSLKKGNLVEVHSQGETFFISANPPAGKVELFDANKSPVEIKHQPKHEESHSNGQANINSNKNGKEVTNDSAKNTNNKTAKATQGDDLEGTTRTRKRARGGR
jgi:hypothetical protein